MSNDVNKCSELWDDSPKLLDSEDSRALINAYNARLEVVSSGLYPPLDISAVPVLLRFVVDLIAPGTDDLFPTLFGNTIDRFWGAPGQEFEQEARFDNILSFGQVLHYFR